MEPDTIKKIRDELLKQYSGDDTLVDELLEVFRDEIPGLIRGIKDAIEARDAALLATHAHTCKSATGAVGLKEAMKIIALIEQAAKQGDIENARSHYKQLESELRIFLG